MVAPIVIGIAAVVGGFIILRLLMGSSQSEQSKRESEASAIRKMNAVRAYEQKIEHLHRAMRNAPDRQRERMAKQEELLLRQKERLKHTTERLVRKS
ncbi:hypothetical protein HYU40_03445 [Candidatus Woesearchaeota archaeon]|nr:hypothetical protein [Candidatus Woesearchaeota archaeon]